jgi:hypothetical protein
VSHVILTLDEEHWFAKIPSQRIDAPRAWDAFAVALKTAKHGAQAGLPTREKAFAFLAKKEGTASHGFQFITEDQRLAEFMVSETWRFNEAA